MAKVGITFSGDLHCSEVLRSSRLAEEAGVHSIWVAEHYFNRDALTTVSAISAVTNKVFLGTGIVSPYTRHIALLAMSAMTLSEMSRGRFILGLGTNERFLEQLGIDRGSPIGTIKHAVSTLNTLFANGEANFKDVYGKGGTARLGFTSGRPIPIYVGAIGPKMCRLTGELAQGVIFSAGCTPMYVEKAMSWIKEGHGGTLPPGFEVACYIMATKSTEEGRKLARARIARNLSIPGRDMMMDGLEAEGRMLQVRETYKEGNYEKAASLVSNEMVDSVTVTNSPEGYHDRLERFMKAGVTLPVISPMGSRFDDFRSVMTEK